MALSPARFGSHTARHEETWLGVDVRVVSVSGCVVGVGRCMCVCVARHGHVFIFKHHSIFICLYRYRVDNLHLYLHPHRSTINTTCTRIHVASASIFPSSKPLTCFQLPMSLLEPSLGAAPGRSSTPKLRDMFGSIERDRLLVGLTPSRRYGILVEWLT
jgi:hypothetical protein